MAAPPSPDRPTLPAFDPATAPSDHPSDYTLPAALAPTQLTMGSDRDSLTGSVWGDFEVGPLLGKGGMGAVFRGRQRSLDRAVAIKVLPPHLSENADFRNRFEREAKSVAGLDSPHIIKVYGAGQHGGHHFFAMEYVDGHDLAATIRHGGRPTRPRALDWLTQAARGLTAAGELGIVHRDIKPANLMLTTKGVVKIMDFGLVRSTKDSQGLTMTGTVMGTVSYFSPEQGRGDVCDCRTDLYAMGVVMYELLTGSLPFTGDDPTSIIYQHIHVAPTPPRAIDPNIPEDWQAVCLKCLQKSADDRYATAADLLADLERLGRGEKPAIPPAELARLRSGTVLLPGEVAQRRRLMPWMLVAATVTIAAGTALWLAQRPAPGASAAPVASAPAVAAVRSTAGPSTAAAAPVSAAAAPVSAPVSATEDPAVVERQRAGNAALDLSEAALASGDLTTASAHATAATPLIGPTAPRLLDALRRIDARRSEALEAARQASTLAAGHSGAQPPQQARLALDAARRLAPNLAEVIEAERAVILAEQRAGDALRLRDQRLAEADAALRDSDLDTAEQALRGAQQADPEHPTAVAGLRSIAERRERIRAVLSAADAALTGDELPTARQRIADLAALAPRHERLAALAQAATALDARLTEHRRAAEAREQQLANRAAALLTRIDDPRIAMPRLEAELAALLNDAGTGGRSEEPALRAALAQRRDRDAVTGLLDALDTAVLAGDQAAIRALVLDTVFANSLIALSQQPGLVFASTLRECTPNATGALRAAVDVRNAFATFPETTLPYHLIISRRDDLARPVVITTATATTATTTAP